MSFLYLYTLPRMRGKLKNNKKNKKFYTYRSLFKNILCIDFFKFLTSKICLTHKNNYSIRNMHTLGDKCKSLVHLSPSFQFLAFPVIPIPRLPRHPHSLSSPTMINLKINHFPVTTYTISIV